MVTDSNGNNVQDVSYYPYGKVNDNDGPFNSRYKFTGKELDDSTDLYFYEARYYDPNLGRFIQSDSIVPDPFNPQDLNRYSYVRNNPIIYTDPSGSFPDYSFGGGYLGGNSRERHLSDISRHFEYEPFSYDLGGGLDGGGQGFVGEIQGGVYSRYGEVLDFADLKNPFAEKSSNPNLLGGLNLDKNVHFFGFESSYTGAFDGLGLEDPLFAPYDFASIGKVGIGIAGVLVSIGKNPIKNFFSKIFNFISGFGKNPKNFGSLVNTTRAILRKKAGFSDSGTPIILDTNLEAKGLVDILRVNGFNVRSVSEIFGKDVGDSAINQLANKIGAKVLTRDRGRQIGQGFGNNAIQVDSRVRNFDDILRILKSGL